MSMNYFTPDYSRVIIFFQMQLDEQARLVAERGMVLIGNEEVFICLYFLYLFKFFYLFIFPVFVFHRRTKMLQLLMPKQLMKNRKKELEPSFQQKRTQSCQVNICLLLLSCLLYILLYKKNKGRWKTFLNNLEGNFDFVLQKKK